MLAVGALDVLARQLDAFQGLGQRQHKIGLRHTLTSRPSMMAKVSGRRSVTVVPGRACWRRRWCRAGSHTLAGPRPCPRRGRRPRSPSWPSKNPAERSGRRSRPRPSCASAAISPLSTARACYRFGIDSAAIVRDCRPARWRPHAAQRDEWSRWDASPAPGEFPAARCRDPCCCESDASADRPTARSPSCPARYRRLRS